MGRLDPNVTLGPPAYAQVMSWRNTTDLESSWGYRALGFLALLTGYVGGIPSRT